MEVFDQTFFSQGDDVSVSPDNFMISSSKEALAWTAVNQPSGASPTGTVSPTDLALEPSMTMSAPSSTAFPNLNTPGSHVLDSPYWGYNNGGSSSLDTSPLHPDGQLDASLDTSDWTGPLFPDPISDPFAEPLPSTEVVSTHSADSSSPMVRQKSGGSPGRPIGSGRKASDVAGISKANKSRKPLPDIVIDDNDDREVAKRKKNTAAARKSRERKLERFQDQEQEIARLAALNDDQKIKIERMQRYIIAMGGNPHDADFL
ncbi:putative bzip transcription factor [Phaeomoniella chlamydospora]|uniref:Putative bzip transcription factor n=1 Tax=Phaeomoniella chlamydospora TaxID=158046 RepID=A0A0G2GWR8_PHACM|nr:putative bzip transcription factor [Phaeomoniella chlamydospora]